VAEYINKDVYGLPTLELPKDYTPLEAIVSIKCLNENGHPVLLHRYTKTLTSWEALGMAHSMCDQLAQNVKENFIPCDGPENEEDPDA
jgi:hypothetical protein